MSELMDDRAAGVTFIARSLGVVALIALVLAVMGLYSLMAFNVSRRTQELGVRMALGATRWQVIGLTIGKASASRLRDCCSEASPRRRSAG